MGEGTPVDLGIDGIEEAVAIGTGASATVYRARQPRLGRTVAVKVINAVGEEDTLRRFAREALALGSLSEHPGIVTVYEVGSTLAGHPFLTMQYCAGGSLRERIRENGPYEPDEARVLVADVARTVASAHAQGITHRDLKPANILVGNDGRPLVADFGIAALANVTAGVTAATAFTPSYAPPEVLRGEAPGEPGDVYSLGASLFHMLLGRVPFASTDGTSGGLVALARRIDTESVEDLRRHGIPHRLAAAVEAAMQKEPMRRPSMVEFAALLDAATGPGPSTEPPTVRAPRATPLVPPPAPTPAPPTQTPVLPAAASPLPPSLEFHPTRTPNTPDPRPSGPPPSDSPLPSGTPPPAPGPNGARPSDGTWWDDPAASDGPADAGDVWWAGDDDVGAPVGAPTPPEIPYPAGSSPSPAPSTVSGPRPIIPPAPHRPAPTPVEPSRQTRTTLIVIVLALAAIATIAAAIVIGRDADQAAGSTTTAAVASATPRPTTAPTPTATPAPEPTATPVPTATPRPAPVVAPRPPGPCPSGLGRQDEPSITVVPNQVRRAGEREFRICGAGWTAAPPVFVLPCFTASSPEEIAAQGAAACDTAALTPATPAGGAFEVRVTYDVPRGGMCIAAGDAGQSEAGFACVRIRRNN